MYSKIFESKKISIRNCHMEKLLERFDYRKFKPNENLFSPADLKMQNNTPCILCKSFYPHKYACVGCPLVVLKSSTRPGCITIITKLVSNNSPLHTFIGSVMYLASYETQALKDLKMITEFLKSFKKE